MIQLKYMLISVILLIATITQAETSKVGTTAAQFLKIGTGARAVAMGEAFTGQADEVVALFWNPAGLAQLTQREVVFSHSQWLAGLKYQAAGIALPFSAELGTVGFLAASLSTPEDVVRTVYQPAGTGETFQSVDLALGVAYARNLTPQLAVGGTLKYIRQSVWNTHGSSWALDFGGLYRSDFKHLKVGIAVTNFGAPLKMGGESSEIFVDFDPDFSGNVPLTAELSASAWELPLLFRMGIAFDLIHSNAIRWTVVSDFNHPSDNSEYLNAGCEYAFREIFFVRAGYRGLGIHDSEGGLTAGTGIRLSVGASQIRFNYAFVDYGRLEATHRYELAFTF